MIRVRRYEIIKLGLDGGEGDGSARRGVEERKGGKAERVKRRRWMSEAMGRRMVRGTFSEEGSKRITVFRILVYERQPRRLFETRAATAAVVAAEES